MYVGDAINRLVKALSRMLCDIFPTTFYRLKDEVVEFSSKEFYPFVYGSSINDVILLAGRGGLDL